MAHLKPMKILGIETSCDETSVAVVEDGARVLSNIIASSSDLHALTGGVVPEVAAREHMRQMTPVLDEAMRAAQVSWDDIDAIAVTHCPGLIASLLIGVSTAQTLAYIHQKPLIPTHHIAGHIYSTWLDRETQAQFPILTLTVSGGHNELVLLKNHWEFETLGETLDDAAGEAFDKVARLLGLGYPGGPVIAKKAEAGNPQAFDLPRPMLDEANRLNFSFSGLKSAVRRVVSELGSLNEKTITDLAASFQSAVVDTLVSKVLLALEAHDVKEVHLAGGVSANQRLRQALAEKLPTAIPFFTPQKLSYCTDNAAMIAGAAYFLQQVRPDALGHFSQVEVRSQAPLG